MSLTEIVDLRRMGAGFGMLRGFARLTRVAT